MKTVFCHLDTVHEMTNIDLGQCQKSKKITYAEKETITLQWGGKES